ncbi:relaxase/mobilization nuclease domain-containing protein [Corynebacterium renale]|uniref:relaxase/mobilization nuclease domain-containing protein n=1 Tax=Corynebacterium renale TaxID=1724 RepID=UPI000E1BB81A|nr:relaxase/mobilization nuclease domain-containing protein [Corynebacterium renale]
MMSVSKVQRSKSAVASVIYAVYGTVQAREKDSVRTSAVSVIGPRGDDPMAWAMEVRDRVAESVQRKNETLNIIQSFSPEELDPSNALDVEKAHATGLEVASRLAPDCDVVVVTHIDTAHVHNHIIVANHDRSTGKAAPKEVGNAWRVRAVNDAVMKDFDLEVLAQHEVSYSRQERMALRQGRDIDGAEKVPSELTSDTWREFLRARVEDLLDDERVVGAIDVAGADGVEPALDAMEDIAGEYGLSFSRRGRGKRKSERSSFAIVDEDGEVLRVPKQSGSGTVKAASAGSRLGADYTLNALRAALHKKHLERSMQEMQEMRALNHGTEYPQGNTPRDNRSHRGNDGAGVLRHGSQPAVQGAGGDSIGDTSRRSGAARELSAAAERARRADERLEAFNRRDEGLRNSDGERRSSHERNGGDSHGVAGSHSEAARGAARPVRSAQEVRGRDRSTAGVFEHYPQDGSRAGGRSVELEQRRRRAAERLRREAVESLDPKTAQRDNGPEF